MSNWAKLQEDTIQLPVFKRAKHGIHFKNNDGSITANFSGKPCHFQDTDGLWKPIDTTLLPLGDGYYGCPHSKVKVHPDGHVAVAGTDYIQRVTLPSAQAGLLDGDKLVRKFSFGEQRMWVTEDGFKSEIQLNRIPTLTEARKLIASESGTLSKKYLKSLTTATDATGKIHTYSTLAAFRTWLASATFPVVIDPDFEGMTADGHILGQHGTDYATARSTSVSATYGATDYIALGQDTYGATGFTIYRAYELFDTSSIGAGSTVTQVNLKLYVQNNLSATDFDVQIVKYNWSEWAADQANATKRETAYDGCLAGTADDSIWKNTADISAGSAYTSGNLSTAWVSKTGTTYYGLRSSRDKNGDAPTGDEWIDLGYAGHTTVGRRPVLTVTYTAGGSITPIVQYYNRLRRN